MSGDDRNDLTISGHALDEMRRDAISRDQVYHVIPDADVEYERSDGRVRYECILEDGRQIIVIVEGATRTVITAWWDKRRSTRQRRRWN